MKLTKSIAIAATIAINLAALCGGGPGHVIPIVGQWDEWNPDQFRASNQLDRHHTFTITNDTESAITVVLVSVEANGRTPREYFPILNGGFHTFGAPWALNPRDSIFSFDLFMRGHVGSSVSHVLLTDNGLEHREYVVPPDEVN